MDTKRATNIKNEDISARENETFKLLATLYMESEWETVTGLERGRETAQNEEVSGTGVVVDEGMAERAEIVDFTSSERFRRRMRAIVLRNRVQGAAVSVSRKAAGVILAVIVGTGVLMLINEEVRAEILRFFRVNFEKYTVYSGKLRTEDFLREPKFYYLKDVPEGYELISWDESSIGESDYEYVRSATEKLFFTVQCEDGFTVGIDTEDSEYQAVLYQKGIADYYKAMSSSHVSAFTWENEYGYRYYLQGNFTLEEFMKMADGVVEKDRTPRFYELTSIPEEYEVLSAKEETDGSGKYIYGNKAGMELFSLEIYYDYPRKYKPEVEIKEHEEFEYNGMLVKLYPAAGEEENSLCIWRDAHDYVFILVGNLSKEEFMKISKGVKLKEK